MAKASPKNFVAPDSKHSHGEATEHQAADIEGCQGGVALLHLKVGPEREELLSAASWPTEASRSQGSMFHVFRSGSKPT